MKTKHIKNHRFVVVVKGFGTRCQAELALLFAFASRKPDGVAFYLRKRRP